MNERHKSVIITEKQKLKLAYASLDTVVGSLVHFLWEKLKKKPESTLDFVLVVAT